MKESIKVILRKEFFYTLYYSYSHSLHQNITFVLIPNSLFYFYPCPYPHTGILGVVQLCPAVIVSVAGQEVPFLQTQLYFHIEIYGQ